MTSNTVSGSTLLLGGARSGKSALAVDIATRSGGDVTFIATARPIDADMSTRITRHRADRPPWPTIEAPLDLAAAVEAAAGSVVIIDCLTLWVANAMHDGWSDECIADSAHAVACTAAARTAPTVTVSNEVGLGIHPASDLGRRYRDLLGRVNNVWAAQTDRTLLLVAGRAIPLHDPWEFLT